MKNKFCSIGLWLTVLMIFGNYEYKKGKKEGINMCMEILAADGFKGKKFCSVTEDGIETCNIDQNLIDVLEDLSYE